LTPLNTSIVLKGELEEITLPLKGKKKKLTRRLLVHYFGKEQCGITDKIIEQTLHNIQTAIPSWFDLINISFLSDEMKLKYKGLLNKRIEILGLDTKYI
jgi:serine/threonine-protein kinase HipA